MTGDLTGDSMENNFLPLICNLYMDRENMVRSTLSDFFFGGLYLKMESVPLEMWNHPEDNAHTCVDDVKVALLDTTEIYNRYRIWSTWNLLGRQLLPQVPVLTQVADDRHRKIHLDRCSVIDMTPAGSNLWEALLYADCMLIDNQFTRFDSCCNLLAAAGYTADDIMKELAKFQS